MKWFGKLGERLKEGALRIRDDNSGVGIIEVILILVILIAVVLIFKDQIMAIVNDAFQSIRNDSSNIVH